MASLVRPLQYSLIQCSAEPTQRLSDSYFIVSQLGSGLDSKYVYEWTRSGIGAAYPIQSIFLELQKVALAVIKCHGIA